MMAVDIAGPPWPYHWPNNQRPIGWGDNHVDCNCGRSHGITELDLLDVLVNAAGIEEDRAAALLWDDRTPPAAAATWRIRAGLFARVPGLSVEVVFP